MKLFLLFAILLLAVPAFGDSFTLPTEFRGWITSAGDSNGSSSGINNYYAGIDFLDFSPALELRDWFEFDLSSITGTVVSASLQIATGTYVSPESSEAYQLTSLPASFGFSDLGNGTFYGSQVYTSLDSATTQTIALDAAAITAIAGGGTFGLGGRITTLAQPTPWSQDEAIFSSVSGDPAQVELIVTTSDTAPVAPEPASLLLFAAGLGTIQLLRRVRQ